MLVDTHAHLNLPPLLEHWSEVMDRSERAGVSPVIVPGANLDSSNKAVELAQADSRIFASVGIHPEEAGKDGVDVSRLYSLAKKPRVVAIGECGLDYYRTAEIKELQKKLFESQVRIAQELDLPMIIHSRTPEAMSDALHILNRKAVSGMVFHCFSGDLAFWRQIEPLGAYVGVGATITYPKNVELRETVNQVPLERIVFETDAPWLPPQPKRGQINEPQNVTICALKLAEIKQIQLSEVLEITGNNTLKLFPRLQS